MPLSPDVADVVQVPVDCDDPQTDGSTCGPNSASRLLRAYGHAVAYAAMVALMRRHSWTIHFGLGSTPRALAQAMRTIRPETELQQDTPFERILELVADQKLVLALIREERSIWALGSFPALHWITVYGFEQSTETIFMRDTNGQDRHECYRDFRDRWEWLLPWGIPRWALDAAGVRGRTIIY